MCQKDRMILNKPLVFDIFSLFSRGMTLSPTAPAVLLIEPDPLLAGMVTTYLTQIGYRVVEAASATDHVVAALVAAGQEAEAYGLAVPVLLLGAAYPHLPKPFRLPDLGARLAELVRQPVSLGPVLLDVGARCLRGDKTAPVVRLTEKETALLLRLRKADGACISRDQLLGEVWGYGSGVTTHTLETHIYRLRKKLKSYPDLEHRLVTEDGGYRLSPLPSISPVIGVSG
jgi:DNA-binding response OmpR family regulator